MDDSPDQGSVFRESRRFLVARPAQIETGKEAADNLYEVNTAEDIPLMTWTYEDPACQGIWMRAEHLNGKYDFMTGFSATVIGEHGLIELLGEGGGGLYWDGRPLIWCCTAMARSPRRSGSMMKARTTSGNQKCRTTAVPTPTACTNLLIP